VIDRIVLACSISALLVCAFAEPATALNVTLNPGGQFSNLEVRVRDVAGDVRSVQPTAVPFTDAHTVTLDEATSTASYELTSTGFQIDFSHARTSSDFALASVFGFLYFSVDEDIGYSISGAYQVSDTEG